MSFLRSYRPTRLHLAIGAAVLVLVVAGVALYAFLASPAAGVHARLQAGNVSSVKIREPVTVRFDQPVDLARVNPVLEPAAEFTVSRTRDRLVITPAAGWKPATAYTVSFGDVPNASRSATLHGFRATFTTQPKVGVAGFQVDGHGLPADNTAGVGLRSKVTIAFTTPMKPASVTVTQDGNPVPADRLQWAPDGQSVSVAPGSYLPYQSFKLGVSAQGATSAQGDVLTDTATATLTPQALEPSNSTSGITAGWTPVPPIAIVIENSDAARPQTGLQSADMVWEYVSEYNISRMTAVWFNRPPGLVGPVRSCRMINPFLGFAYTAETMCSGASVGTLHYMFFDPNLVPGTINDFDRGNHFFRTTFKAAPHNLYTDGDRAVRLRDEWHLAQPPYQVDPPHDDVDAGAPADAPSVPLHHVAWSYDAGSRLYGRIDTGSAAIDSQTGQQLRAKNVVLLHVPFHDAGWVEDDNGGAHSVWYDMLGSGPADVYSDGKLVHATWHMGAGGPQPFYDNHQPLWFTDDSGKVIELNTGLTWIHVIGNGQNS